MEVVKREIDAPRMVAEPWLSGGLHGSGLMAMAAVEAAFFQGPRAGRDLDHALRGALFEQGLDVSRREVILDVASALQEQGLDLARLRRDLRSASEKQWKERLLDRRNDARIRGVSDAPALQVGQRLMVGLHDAETYVEAIVETIAGLAKAGLDVPVA